MPDPGRLQRRAAQTLCRLRSPVLRISAKCGTVRVAYQRRALRSPLTFVHIRIDRHALRGPNDQNRLRVGPLRRREPYLLPLRRAIRDFHATLRSRSMNCAELARPNLRDRDGATLSIPIATGQSVGPAVASDAEKQSDKVRESYEPFYENFSPQTRG